MRYSATIRARICLAFLSIAGLSCQSGSSSRENNQSADTSSTASTTATGSTRSDSLCFRQTLNRDTTTLHLLLTGNRATGQIDIRPYEKDRARGTFSGTRTGNTIDGDWLRSGEGTTETYALTFTLAGDSISWGEGERVQQQGRWLLKQPGGTYRYVLAKVPCR